MKSLKMKIAVAGLFVSGAAFFGQPLVAQQRVCGTDALHEQMLQNPAYKREMDKIESDYVRFVNEGIGTEKVTGGVRKVPVVVHFIQTSDVELVPDSKVYSQIEVLNEDFRKISGTNGDGNGVDTQYEFCLATIDPDGCPTTGINRVVAPEWAYHEQADAVQMKGLIQWNPQKYLNIWVPRTIETSSGTGQVIGYATFPFNLSLAPYLDGVVIHSSYFGRDASSVYRGRTTTHEVGHWLGLFHTFQNGCQGNTANTCASQGDRVCDTPQAAAANFGCPAINSCVDSPVDDPDQIENYMDYSDGVCQSMFTAGQKTRMDFYTNSIRTTLWSPSNLTATGCDGTVSQGCAPIAEFKGDKIVVCVGQSVDFSDLSIRGATSWDWTFSGGTPGTSTSQNPVVTYNTVGSYNVSLTAGNSIGSGSETKAGYIEVIEPSQSLLIQGFEGIFSLPQYWTVQNNGGLRSWQLVAGVSSEGQNSMKVNNFEARNDGESVRLISNPFSLQFMQTAEMTFDYSYKKFSGLIQDGLAISISTDCGTTWELLWSKTGPYLATVAGNAATAEWVPSQASHWLSDTISLDSFVGQPNVKVQFEVLTGGGQAVYLDNINMSGVFVSATDPNALTWSFEAGPNPFKNDLKVSYVLQRSEAIEFSLSDLSGKQLFYQKLGRQAAGRHDISFDSEALRNLPAGVYFLKGQAGEGTITRKLIKMN